MSAGYVPPAFLTPPFPRGHLIIDATGSATNDPAFFRADFAHDLNPKLAVRLAAAHKPESLGILFTHYSARFTRLVEQAVLSTGAPS